MKFRLNALDDGENCEITEGDWTIRFSLAGLLPPIVLPNNVRVSQVYSLPFSNEAFWLSIGLSKKGEGIPFKAVTDSDSFISKKGGNSHSICSLEFSCPAFCKSSKGPAKVARNRAAKCKKAAEEEFKRCLEECIFVDCVDECQNQFRRELETCPCWQNDESRNRCTERTVLDLEQYRIMVDDLQEHANGLERENQKLKDEIEMLNQKSQNLKTENERLSSEEKRLNTRNYNLWKKLREKDSEIKRLQTEKENLIAANEELRTSKTATEEVQTALAEIKEDLDETKMEKSEIQEDLDIERIRNSDLQSEIEYCRNEIQEEKEQCLKTTQALTIDLERTEDEKEAIETRMSNYEKDLEKLEFENKNCFGREKNSLMVLSGYRSKTKFLSYVLKPDGSESHRRIKIPSSNKQFHYLYAAISALIRGKIYIFGAGGINDSGLRIRMISGCGIKELDVKLNNQYYWGSSVVTAADQQSAMICFPEDEERKKCDEFDGSAVSIKPATKYSHKNSCLALYSDQPVAVSSHLSDGYKKVEKFDGATWTEMEDFPKAILVHSCIGVFDGYLLLGGSYQENNEYYSSKDVYLLRDSKWTVVGKLNEKHWYSSATRIGNTIYLVGGSKEPFAVEKLEWDGEEISSAKVINNHSGDFPRPIIFPVDEFYCT
ncbi:Oidioi.mRNA.OKI2018_I69.chr1.g3784.t1.cds [Oikopleura dioica]|uniref:Oidioi.mRNA.OKI2018_I69.chr1.g3784.t1.cds n=1 Tax=Oikopleura dioica TaxID=34765 RepID=A0ABN7SWZ1_OIKDI|nr:Oidioi.mRNA.OKI2018_I69.chr1.g3784.t1.cds [Oikopleura dioica]